MLVTWTVLQGPPGGGPPWTPDGARWWQAGLSSPGRAEAPRADGSWWSVLATWDGPPPPPVTADGVAAWHLLLRAVSVHGDVVLAGGAEPFAGLPGDAPLDGGPVALLTVAGTSPDDAREREFFRRFGHVSRDIGSAPGHLLSMVGAPAPAGTPGPVLTLSVWQDLAAGVDWAYTRSRPHAVAVPRQRSHGLVRSSGSVRCAVLASGGSLAGAGDPLAAL